MRTPLNIIIGMAQSTASLGICSGSISRRALTHRVFSPNRRRNSPNIIIGMASLALQPDCDQEKMRGYLNKIGAASQQLLALINDILEISRLEQGNVSP